MASLQDQLLKAGLIDTKKAKQANKEKRKETNVARRSNEEVVDEVKQSAEQARLEKVERDRELNRQRDLELQQKAIAAQIKQLSKTIANPKVQAMAMWNITLPMANSSKKCACRPWYLSKLCVGYWQ
jgi:uncharacterized protein YaiL (DUF2058 family)